LLSYLITQSRLLLLVAALASIVSGVCSVLLLAQINQALTADAAGRASLVGTFAAVAVLAMLSHMAAGVLFEHLSQRIHAELRRFVATRVIASDYRRLEEIGGPRVHSALSEHSGNVAEFFVSAPTILINSIIVGGCMVYMAILSWQVFAVALLALALGTLGYHLAHLRAIKHLDAAAREQDGLFDHFRSLVDGAKELRLNRAKRQNFTERLLGTSIETVRRRRARGMSIFLLSSSWGSFLIYAFIGLVLFALVGEVPDRARIMTGFALVFLYMMTPLEALLLSLPRANLARASAARIEEITAEMPCETPRLDAPSDGAASAAAQPLEPAVVELKGLSHRYFHEQSNEVFALGPVDLRFAPGELVFLVGGNGSGKTSLAKLLVGLYAPEAGEIQVDGVAVTAASRDDYRQRFSAIFSDFHLFERLLDVTSHEFDSRGNELLTKLQLQHKVQVRDGAFTTRALSQGQRKRLALVVAYLEDRPFLVFDEWAADQDPVFKDVFYRELLPELRMQGKTVLVISHDDRYFDLADRVLHMEEGQLKGHSPLKELVP
jgi:putative ATP-binding cassette transporter